MRPVNVRLAAVASQTASPPRPHIFSGHLRAAERAEAAAPAVASAATPILAAGQRPAWPRALDRGTELPRVRAVLMGSGSDGMGEPEVVAAVLRLAGADEGRAVAFRPAFRWVMH